MKTRKFKILNPISILTILGLFILLGCKSAGNQGRVIQGKDGKIESICEMANNRGLTGAETSGLIKEALKKYDDEVKKLYQPLINIDYKDDKQISFTLINQNDFSLTIGQVFFLHPEFSEKQGGGFSGITNIIPREDLGDVLIDLSNKKTQVLKDFKIKMPANSTGSFKLEYSFLNPENKNYEDWKHFKDKMILGITYFFPFKTDYSIAKNYAPLYDTTDKDFELTLKDLFEKIDKEWKEFCCPKGICECD